MPINKLKTTSIEIDAITADLLAAGSVTVADIPDGEIDSVSKVFNVAKQDDLGFEPVSYTHLTLPTIYSV